MIFGLGGKICIVKIETWIVFPEPFEPCFTNQKLIYGDESDTVVKITIQLYFLKDLFQFQLMSYLHPRVIKQLIQRWRGTSPYPLYLKLCLL